MLFTRLDLPKLDLPENWYDDSNGEFVSKQTDDYQSYYLTEQVKSQVENIFPNNFFKDLHVLFICATFKSGVNDFIHRDARNYAINYLVDSGGDVTTNFYNEQRKLLDNFKQKNGEWYFLNTLNNHAVSNITGTRLQVSISFKDDLRDHHWKFINKKAIK